MTVEPSRVPSNYEPWVMVPTQNVSQSSLAFLALPSTLERRSFILDVSHDCSNQIVWHLPIPETFLNYSREVVDGIPDTNLENEEIAHVISIPWFSRSFPSSPESCTCTNNTKSDTLRSLPHHPRASHLFLTCHNGLVGGPYVVLRCLLVT